MLFSAVCFLEKRTENDLDVVRGLVGINQLSLEICKQCSILGKNTCARAKKRLSIEKGEGYICQPVVIFSWNMELEK